MIKSKPIFEPYKLKTMTENKNLFEYLADICKPKFCGQSTIMLQARVKVHGITGEDSYLNGITGTATHPFAFGETGEGWIGVYADAAHRGKVAGEKFNVHQ